MELYCPHCEMHFKVADPFAIAGDTICPLCSKAIYVEVDEGDEGPIFTAYKEMPTVELFHPASNLH